MIEGFKPMLAPSETPATFRFPLLGSPKIDGVRAVVVDGVAYSRSLKPIPNAFVQSVIGRPEFEGLDGELAVGVPYDLPGSKLMQRTTKGVMTKKGEPDFTFWVFDNVRPGVIGMPYNERFAHAREAVWKQTHSRVKMVDTALDYFAGGQILLTSQRDLDAYEEVCLGEGFEGFMARTSDGVYKFGRCTEREWNVLKGKRFADGEAVVVGATELMHNHNEATTNELGRTKRSSHKANKVGGGVLGALVCLLPGLPMPDASELPLQDEDPRTFNIGTGFNADQKREYYELFLKGELVGKIAHFKHFANAGVKDKPRIPVFKAFRDERDM